ncbi:hypothetical protein PILCRDRAFT_155534 [Piloderma croceum F 1598]|uniref:Uncharacterized protein n=1 Tax=Piloderma croceum (strain F 1598) TaxID=765440 RepID=A0A0C3G3P3_PILCF|nr:hypothetical protein PILCRDRAFT_155534 [Piloderma croceum F 1598]
MPLPTFCDVDPVVVKLLTNLKRRLHLERFYCALIPVCIATITLLQAGTHNSCSGIRMKCIVRSLLFNQSLALKFILFSTFTTTSADIWPGYTIWVALSRRPMAGYIWLRAHCFIYFRLWAMTCVELCNLGLWSVF